MANAEALANNFHSTLTAALNASATTVTVVSVTGAPATPFRAVIGPVTGEPTEVVTVTGISTLTLTLTRASEAIAGFTGGQAHASGDAIQAGITAAGLQQALVDSTVPVTQAFGDAAATGSATSLAYRDHKHGMPSFATPAIVLGSAAAAGSATTPIRSDGTIAAFDTTMPAISGPWNTGAVGTAAFAARRDHVHGRDAESVSATGSTAGTAPGFETITRDLAGASGVTTNVPASGTLQVSAIWLPSGLVHNNIAVRSGTTGANGPTHWWFGLYGNGLGLLAATADQTSTAWAASTSKVLAIATIASGASASFTTIYSGLYYVGFLMTSTVSNVSLVTVPSLINGIGPVLGATSDTGLTTPSAFPHTAASLVAATAARFYAYVN